MARFVVAASCLAVLFGSSCGPTVPKPDAGTGTGGGLSGTGGGTGATGGGSAGGSATGGGSAGGSSGDGGLNCTQITQPITWNGGAASGSYELQNDGGVGVHYTGVVFGPGAAGPFTSLDIQLYNETPATPLVFPLTGTFEAINNTFTVYPASLLGQNCTMTGENCQQVFISTRGTYTFTAATQVVDAGTYVGSLANVRYRQINPANFTAVPDGGCVDVSSFIFNTRWP